MALRSRSFGAGNTFLTHLREYRAKPARQHQARAAAATPAPCARQPARETHDHAQQRPMTCVTLRAQNALVRDGSVLAPRRGAGGYALLPRSGVARLRCAATPADVHAMTVRGGYSHMSWPGGGGAHPWRGRGCSVLPRRSRHRGHAAVYGSVHRPGLSCAGLVTASRQDGGVAFRHAEDFVRTIPDSRLAETGAWSHLLGLGGSRL